MIISPVNRPQSKVICRGIFFLSYTYTGTRGELVGVFTVLWQPELIRHIPLPDFGTSCPEVTASKVAALFERCPLLYSAIWNYVLYGGIILTQQLNLQTPGQVAPMNKHKNQQRNTGISFVINGCAVSCTSKVKGTDEPLAAVKEILLSAYRTRMTRS